MSAGRTDPCNLVKVKHETDYLNTNAASFTKRVKDAEDALDAWLVGDSAELSALAESSASDEVLEQISGIDILPLRVSLNIVRGSLGEVDLRSVRWSDLEWSEEANTAANSLIVNI
jgi:hypothetical protein